MTAGSEDAVFQTPTATVSGYTRVCEDGRLAAAPGADDGGRMVDPGETGSVGFPRFFLATGPSFSPSPASRRWSRTCSR